MKIRTVKTILWFLLGIGLTIIVFRIIHGPGAVVALTDMIPWGLWKGGGVVALVPIGGAGFTVAAFVYVFHWKRYKPLAIGAVLLGLMCYTSVAIGLTFDIGIWWRIVFPLKFWQLHSTLFEIAWCIMLYLGVLALEFSHVVFKEFGFTRVLGILDKFTIVFVIVGISLSSLHQSSLGTLFLATPYRLHPLWHTDLLPLLFFITSVGLGCLSISWVAIVTHRLYGARQPMNAISGLGRIASFVLIFYLLIKFAEIVIAGEASFLIQPTWDTVNFWLEVSLGGFIPAALLLRKKYRQSPTAMFWIGSIAILGISLNRVNVAGLATVSTTHQPYFPAWTEWAVTFGILSGAALVFLYCVERFGVFEAIDPERIDAVNALEMPDRAQWKTIFFHNPGSEIRLYSISFVLSVGIAVGLLPDSSIFGLSPEKTPVQGPRVVEISKTRDPDANGTRFEVSPFENGHVEGKAVAVLMIDGNRDGDYVLFDHELHIAKQGGRDASCVRCHHMKNPYEKVSKCSSCHVDMYLEADIFNHEHHVKKMNGNDGCAKCHTKSNATKSRQTAKNCNECHKTMRPQGTLVQIAKDRETSMAPGYMDALHGLCIDCHEKEKDKLEERNEDFARCSNCHRNLPRLTDERWGSRL
jgi:Ni/Fe-hydrogenase subunit HybB-like protein